VAKTRLRQPAVQDTAIPVKVRPFNCNPLPTKIDFKHAIAHNKVVIVDGHTVQQGSFNYTKAAGESNGENVLVNWSNPKHAEVYLKDWKRHWEHSEAVAARY
jgi:phosphatidylserine/phosphatidylglycerophosphate/cardiolipin synthase-like enzyme